MNSSTTIAISLSDDATRNVLCVIAALLGADVLDEDGEMRFMQLHKGLCNIVVARTERASDFLHGGPFDGTWLEDEHVLQDVLYVSCGSGLCRLAVYARNDISGLLEFREYCRTGEGRQADLCPESERGAQ